MPQKSKKNQPIKDQGKEIRNFPSLINQKKLELQKIRIDVAIGRQKNVRLIKNLKHEIARLNTKLSQTIIERSQSI